MSEASKHQRYRAGALSACCNACDAPCCPSGTCASIAARSSKSTKNINPRSAMCPRPSLLHLGSALRILWSSSCDPKARKCWPRLHPSSLFEMYCPQGHSPPDALRSDRPGVRAGLESRWAPACQWGRRWMHPTVGDLMGTVRNLRAAARGSYQLGVGTGLCPRWTDPGQWKLGYYREAVGHGKPQL